MPRATRENGEGRRHVRRKQSATKRNARTDFGSGSVANVLELLMTGTIEACRSIYWSSNYTFLAKVVGETGECLAVYKPRRGETPLWDFPDGTLYRREYAAYLVSEALGWSLIPPTVIRDGPHGIGTVQLYVDADPDAHYLTFRDEPRPEIPRLVAFDYIVNNADRKSGHCLKGRDGRIWAIDNGLTFHTLPKLRTVIWDLQGEPLPADLQSDLRTLQRRLAHGTPLAQALAALLTPAEIDALRHRVQHLLESGRFPLPGSGRHYPWPLV